MSEKNHPFVMFPTRIWNLPGITVQLLKFYEKIFQFWHQGRECFVSNSLLKEYTGMSSDSTISEAFQYFESHGEMKRVSKNNRRYVIAPSLKAIVEEDTKTDLPSEPTNNTHPLAVARPPSRCSETLPLAVARHNKIIINNINEKREHALSISDFKISPVTELCNRKNLIFEDELRRYMNHYEGKNISVGRFLNWIERAKDQNMNISSAPRLDEYVKGMMASTGWTEEQTRHYYREKGYE